MFRNLFRKKPSPSSARAEMRCGICGYLDSRICGCDEDERIRRSLAQQMVRPLRLESLPYPPALPTADTMGPIRAWRLWKIRGERLVSLTREVAWKPGQPLHAEYGPGQYSLDGIYAVKTREHKFGAYDGDKVLGEVGLWGRVIEHEHGFRAEYAYPIRLVWPKTMPGFPRPMGELRRLQALAETYGIPLDVEEA